LVETMFDCPNCWLDGVKESRLEGGQVAAREKEFLPPNYIRATRRETVMPPKVSQLQPAFFL
jgi:hypothetical protein